MKKFIAIAIFSIGLFIASPLAHAIAAPPPDQVSFVVADIQQASPAYEFQAIAIEAPVYFVESTLRVTPVYLADVVVQQSPNFMMFYKLHYRTCLQSQVQSQNLQRNFIAQGMVFRIRSDTSLIV